MAWLVERSHRAELGHGTPGYTNTRSEPKMVQDRSCTPNVNKVKQHSSKHLHAKALKILEGCLHFGFFFHVKESKSGLSYFLWSGHLAARPKSSHRALTTV